MSLQTVQWTLTQLNIFSLGWITDVIWFQTPSGFKHCFGHITFYSKAVCSETTWSTARVWADNCSRRGFRVLCAVSAHAVSPHNSFEFWEDLWDSKQHHGHANHAAETLSASLPVFRVLHLQMSGVWSFFFQFCVALLCLLHSRTVLFAELSFPQLHGISSAAGVH